MRQLMLLVFTLLTACGGAQTTQPIVAPTEIAQTPLPTATNVTLQPTISAPITLRVWWPELLLPSDGTATASLQAQIDLFQAVNPDITVELRLKQVGDVGGIMSTLRTAWAVAPDALPDLTLLRRTDLLLAESAGLIRPLAGDASTRLESVYPAAASLGVVSDDVYGVPYLLEVEHMAYDPAAVTVENWRFDTLLEAGVPFMFPVGRPGALNNLFLAQYFQLSAETGAQPLPLDRDALLRLFTFYADASAAGLIDPLVLETAASDEYAADLASGRLPAALVRSGLYLQLLDEGTLLAPAPLPTDSGEPITILDGWLWVSATPDNNRQAATLRLLNWMMEAERQSDYALAVGLLPSQPAALRQWEAAGGSLAGYAAFIEPLLVAGLPLPTEAAFGVAGRAIQSALAGVLSGQFIPQAAVDEVLGQVGG